MAVTTLTWKLAGELKGKTLELIYKQNTFENSGIHDDVIPADTFQIHSRDSNRPAEDFAGAQITTTVTPIGTVVSVKVTDADPVSLAVILPDSADLGKVQTLALIPQGKAEDFAAFHGTVTSGPGI